MSSVSPASPPAPESAAPTAAFWKNFSLTDKAIALLPAALAGIVVYDQWYLWSTKEDYTFGYAVPFFSLYVIYDRWPKIEAYFRDEPAPGERPASGILNTLFALGAFFSLLCYAGGGLSRAIGGPNILGTIFNTFGFCGVWTGCVWMLSEKSPSGAVRGGRERLGLLALFTFPILVWIVSGPFLYLVDSQIKFFLLEKVTVIDVKFLNLLGYDVSHEGNVLVLPGGDHVSMEDACSGIRSLSACVFGGAIISALFIEGRIRKILMLASSVVAAVGLNILRTSFLTLWAHDHGSQSIDMDFAGHSPKSPEFSLGTVHDLAGYAAMGVTFLILALLVPVINFRLKPPAAPSGSPEDSAPAA